jgi:cytochrome c oxidase assembly protein subunit 11
MITRSARRFLWLGGTAAIILMMTVLVSYSVTLYRLFCSATGAGGTTQRVATDTAKPTDHYVTVFFDSNVAPNMPWRFHPLQRSIRVRLGEETPIFYEAENLSNSGIVGRATFNVTPDKAGIYFKKIECFCFTEERLAAHTKVQMPVEFYVDPAIATDAGTTDVREITLSYTFFRAKDAEGAEDMARFEGKPTPQLGEKLFAGDCSACHTPDHAKVGPALGGIVGRTAGTVKGYPYTSALARSGIVWTAQSLDRWLSGPRTLVPGAAMPMSVSDANARAAIIAYLETLHAPPAEQTAAGGSSSGG